MDGKNDEGAGMGAGAAQEAAGAAGSGQGGAGAGAAGGEGPDEAALAAGAGTGAAGAPGGADGAGGAAGIPDGFAAQVAARDARIAELEAQVAEAARSAEATEALREEIALVRAQAAADRTEFELRLAGARSVKAARALLEEHGGDVGSLKATEPWLFADAGGSPAPSGATGLPNAGAATDEAAQLKRWSAIAGIELED